MTGVFNEQSLRAEVVKVWGEHGAHTLVYDALLRRLEALEAFSLHEDKDGRTLLTYEHTDGEACIVAELTCPAVLEVASVLWPATEPDDG